jgi:hypothetical protein
MRAMRRVVDVLVVAVNRLLRVRTLILASEKERNVNKTTSKEKQQTTQNKKLTHII